LEHHSAQTDEGQRFSSAFKASCVFIQNDLSQESALAEYTGLLIKSMRNGAERARWPKDLDREWSDTRTMEERY
jgi:hypothetical protein